MSTRMTQSDDVDEERAPMTIATTTSTADETTTLDTGDDVLTAGQISGLLHDDAGRLGRAEAALSRARHDYDVATHESRYSTTEAHAASFKEHAGPLEAAERSAVDTADAVERNARAVLAQLRQASSQPALAPDDLTAAAARQGLVARDCATLSWPDLRDKMRHALLTDDLPAQYLFLQHGRERLATGDAVGLDQPGQSGAKAEAERLFVAIADRLRDRSLDPVLKRTEDALGRAVTTRLAAGARRRAQESYAFLPARGVQIPEGA